MFVFLLCVWACACKVCPRSAISLRPLPSYICFCCVLWLACACAVSAISLWPLPNYVCFCCVFGPAHARSVRDIIAAIAELCFFFCVLCVMACACTLSAISLQPLVLAQFGSPTIMYMPPTASKTASSGSYRNGAMDTAELCRFKVFFGMSHSLSTHPLATPSKLFGVQITTPRPRLSTRIETQAVHHKCWRSTGVARQEYVRRVPETARPRYLLHSSSFRRQSVHCSEIPSKERRGRAGFILQLWPRVELWWTPSWHEDVRRHV
jgi:hypothetical protein